VYNKTVTSMQIPPNRRNTRTSSFMQNGAES